MYTFWNIFPLQVQRNETFGKFDILIRRCATSCVPHCGIWGDDIDTERCFSCCSTDLCNTDSTANALHISGVTLNIINIFLLLNVWLLLFFKFHFHITVVSRVTLNFREGYKISRDWWVYQSYCIVIGKLIWLTFCSVINQTVIQIHLSVKSIWWFYGRDGMYRNNMMLISFYCVVHIVSEWTSSTFLILSMILLKSSIVLAYLMMPT